MVKGNHVPFQSPIGINLQPITKLELASMAGISRRNGYRFHAGFYQCCPVAEANLLMATHSTSYWGWILSPLEIYRFPGTAPSAFGFRIFHPVTKSN
jgi:hypothetical protein